MENNDNFNIGEETQETQETQEQEVQETQEQEVQEETTEAQEEAEQEPVKPEEKFNKLIYLEKMAKKDKENRELQQRLKKYEALEKAKEGGKKLNILKELGLTPEEILEEWASGGSEEVVEEKPDKLTELEKRLQQMEAEKQQAIYDAQMVKLNSTISNIIYSSEDFELLQQEGDDAVRQVLEVASAVVQEHGFVPDLTEVCKVVENFYFEEYNKKLEKIQKSKKLSSKIIPQKVEKPVSKTLTKSTGSADAGVADMSFEARRKRAMDLLDNMTAEKKHK